MAKFFTYSLLAAALGFASPAFADDAATPALTFTVDRAAVESKMVFQISATDGATIQVDWGDGVLKDVTIADYNAAGYVFTEVDGTIAGTSIKVYAPDARKSTTSRQTGPKPTMQMPKSRESTFPNWQD